jgi:DHA1 family multidrug resistance protein-like MFS transporter
LITLGLFGFALAEFIFAFATDLWMLFLSRIIAGTFGAAIMPSAMAYVSDVTTPEKRGQGMGYLGAAMGLGIVVGPGIGGWLSEFSLSFPFLFAGIAASLAGIVSIFVLPESLSKEAMQKTTAENEKRENQFILIKKALQSPVGFLLILVFMMSFALTIFQAIFGFYALERFGYGPQEVGLIILITGIVGTITQGAAVGRLVAKFGDERVVTSALLLSAFGFVIMTFANSFATVLLTTSIFFLGNSILRPSLNTFISKLAGSKQGMVMGLNNSFMSLGNVAGPILAGYVFEYQINLPYYIGAAVMLAALISTKVWISRRQQADVSV